ncbi:MULTISPECIES: septum formation initiator family protein [Corynebacterium]|uniref:FtsB family cell division protein n=1 Tax=Corynebacterium TaxID=1716 RepID=UPI001CE43895|nr:MULTISPECIES: septum formation initiator family protein [Corynebacterium]
MTPQPRKSSNPGSRTRANQRAGRGRGSSARDARRAARREERMDRDVRQQDERDERDAQPQESRGSLPQARSVERQARRRAQARQAPARLARNFVQLPQRINPGVTVFTALLVAFLAFSIAQPLRNYFEQRSQIAELESKITSQEQYKAELIEEINRYGNENYIKEVARTRLGLIEPGESAFRIISPKIKANGQVGAEGSDFVPGEEEPTAPAPWYEQLWDSISVPEHESVVDDNDEDGPALKLPTVPQAGDPPPPPKN